MNAKGETMGLIEAVICDHCFYNKDIRVVMDKESVKGEYFLQMDRAKIQIGDRFPDSSAVPGITGRSVRERHGYRTKYTCPKCKRVIEEAKE